MKRKYQIPVIRIVALRPATFITTSGSSDSTDYKWGDQSMGSDGGDPEAETGTGGNSRYIWGSGWDL